MTKIEAKLFNWIEKNILIVIFIAVTALGIAIHAFGLKFESVDYKEFLLPWWNKISDGGKSSLAEQVGNYNIPYQIIIYLMSLLPFESLLSYKLLSIVFDFVLAGSAALIVYSFDKNHSKTKAVIAYALVLCSMTVVLNSSFWAQCDSIYVAFILLAIYFVKKDRNILAFVMLGIAFSFKLQTVFIFPVFIYYYVSTRKISVLHFFIIPFVDILMCMPAVLLGRSIKDIIKIYLKQTSQYKRMQMNTPNIWALLCNKNDSDAYELFKNLAICLAVLIIGIGLALIIIKRVDLSDGNTLLLSSLWTVFTCLMFLPSMHERYCYPLDILVLIYVTVNAKHIWLAVAVQLISLRGYCDYLFKYELLDIRLTALMFIAVYIYVSYLFVKEAVINGAKHSERADIIKKTKYRY